MEASTQPTARASLLGSASPGALPPAALATAPPLKADSRNLSFHYGSSRRSKA